MSKTENYPVLRGLLLRILYAQHPYYLNLLEIQQGLDDLRFTASIESVRSELDYLRYRMGEDRPLVVFKELRIPGSQERLLTVKLSALGVDLIEGRLEIPDADQNWIKL